LLKSRGEFAVDADWDGFNHWVHRATGQVNADPPYPVPAGWLDQFAWKISRPEVQRLAHLSAPGCDDHRRHWPSERGDRRGSRVRNIGASSARDDA